MDVEESGTQSAQSQNEYFYKLERPNTWGYLCMIIGVFGSYRNLLLLYELDIIPWRYILPNQPQTGILSQKEEMELI